MLQMNRVLACMICIILSGTASAFEQVFVITVVNDNGNVFAIDDVNKPILNILRSGVYTFDQSDYSNAGHQIAFKDSAGTSYTTGVTTTGTPGTSGAQTVFTVDVDAPDNLLYYCVAHGNSMGNTILVASSTPAESTPSTETAAETTPPATTGQETTPPPPTETTPPETTPSETTPPETTPSETTSPPPTETTPPETTPSETTPPPPTETTPPETTPSETTPPKTPSETSSALKTTQTPFTTPVPANFEPLICVGCPAGFFLSRETLNCTQCPPGSGTDKYSNASSAEQCMCLPGFSNTSNTFNTSNNTPNTSETCVLCPAGSYKETLGNVSCTSCPANSTTPFSGETNATQCVCNAGFKENRTSSFVSSSLMSSSVQPSTTNNRNWINLLSCNKTSVANVQNMPQYYADGAYFHTNPTSQEKILTFQNVPMIVSTHFKAFIRYKVVDFNSLNWDVYFFMSTMGFGGGGGFGANAILQLYRNGATNTETILFTPTGRINTNVGTGTIPNPWAGEWTTVMIDWEQQTGKYTVTWRFNCTAACGACSSACVQSGSKTATGILTSFYKGPYTFRVGGGDSSSTLRNYANLHVSHVLISNNSATTWPTTEELNCTKQESIDKVYTSTDSSTDTSPNTFLPWRPPDCVACPGGTFKSKLGDNECLECTKDHYCPSPSVTPLACPMNSSSAHGSASVHDCLCTEGLVLVLGEDSYICAECYADTYYTKHQETSLGICASCPPNTSSAEGSRSQRDCVCKPGFVTESPSAYDSHSCTGCSAGTFSGTFNSSTCHACVPGKFSNFAASICTDCPIGSVAVEAGMSACVPCPPNTWQDMDAGGYLSTPCSLCPANSGHDLSGVSDVFECNCAAGMYKSPNGTRRFVCTTCEPGFKCSENSVSVVMSITLGLPLSLQEFSTALQLDFRDAIAQTVDVDVSRVKIISISEQASSRRLLIMLFRRLLSSGIAVEFEITLDSTTNVSSVQGPTEEELNQELVSSGLPEVEVLVAPSVVVYNQREACPEESFCAGGEQVFFCRPFSRAQTGSTSQEQCMCEPGYYSLNTTSDCKKCPPDNFCPGGLQVIPCPANATSAAGGHSAEACFCEPGLWRGCSRTESGLFKNNTGHLCIINWTAPCSLCGANDICFNDTLVHCPQHSTSPPGSSKPSHCVCNGGFEEIANKILLT